MNTPALKLADIQAACAAIKAMPPVAVRILMHPDTIAAFRERLPAELGGPQPLAVQVDPMAYLAKHTALIEMSDGTFRTVDLRPRVKQSLHDCRGMKRAAYKRLRRARRAVDDYGKLGPYDLGRVMALDHAEQAARATWLEAIDRLQLAVHQRDVRRAERSKKP
jgi:DMSO/TMAO reductase YedYZ molybdopterin-dependent catalytic subunit